MSELEFPNFLKGEWSVPWCLENDCAMVMATAVITGEDSSSKSDRVWICPVCGCMISQMEGRYMGHLPLENGRKIEGL